MAKPPAFQFYPADFLMGTAFMSHAQVGAYTRLLSHQWDKGPLAYKFVHGILGQEFLEHEVDEILEKFQEEEGKIFNKRLEDERQKQEEFRALQSERGKKSAASRKAAQEEAEERQRIYGGSTGVEPALNQGPLDSGCNQNPTLQSSSSSSSSVFGFQSSSSDTPYSPPKRGTLVSRFEEFWQRYPKKVGKKAVFKIWERLKPDVDLFQKIIKALDVQGSSPQWQKNGGEYIPNPGTWLNQGRWDDEPMGIEAGPDTSLKGSKSLLAGEAVVQRLREQEEVHAAPRVVNP